MGLRSHRHHNTLHKDATFLNYYEIMPGSGDGSWMDRVGH